MSDLRAAAERIVDALVERGQAMPRTNSDDREWIWRRVIKLGYSESTWRSVQVARVELVEAVLMGLLERGDTTGTTATDPPNRT